MFETKLMPETEKFCSEETVPLQAVKALSVPEVDIDGVALD